MPLLLFEHGSLCCMLALYLIAMFLHSPSPHISVPFPPSVLACFVGFSPMKCTPAPSSSLLYTPFSRSISFA